LTVAGIAFLSITAFMPDAYHRADFNHLWQVKPRPFLTRLKLYLFAMLVWPFVLAAVAAAISFTVTTSLGFIEEAEWIRRFSKAISVTVFGMFFRVPLLCGAQCAGVAARRISRRLFATLAFALMQKLSSGTWRVRRF
jgi:membrane protein